MHSALNFLKLCIQTTWYRRNAGNIHFIIIWFERQILTDRSPIYRGFDFIWRGRQCGYIRKCENTTIPTQFVKLSRKTSVDKHQQSVVEWDYEFSFITIYKNTTGLVLKRKKTTLIYFSMLCRLENILYSSTNNIQIHYHIN